MFTLRFDMRAPVGGAPATDLYAAAIDMCEWAETRGAALAVLSEHHGAHDGHLPVPLTLASAIAARTRTLAILLAAVPIALWDPVRLAEEISVLDLISGGRVSYAFGVGHRREEYEHFGTGNVAELRVDGGPYRFSYPTRRSTTCAAGDCCSLHPLCGGVAPEVAWLYLERSAIAAARAHDK
ncbi:hypothetical protein DQP58_09525 [Mycobacterium colombiense]|uniref:Luciferase-like domain-containing protein n=1 Tax=Mycobacterium colombiense TaxID=339268 RepID=A0A329KRQ5_9MYCO|nr:LLM class flavin-dependent oxidoreductase [Mycobacterium colombiense]RAU96731.1 hypothetical protein DQP58_09525 [Mycobacterium colombiense]